MAWLKNSRNGSRDRGRLDEFLAAARDRSAGETLSAGSRDTILNGIDRSCHAEEALPRLFTPTRRIVFAGALPVVLAAALLVGFDQGVQPPVAPAAGATRVAAVKQAGQVLFTIDNGGRSHVVSRSTSPERSADAQRVTVRGGAFEDGLDDQADLVFYRID